MQKNNNNSKSTNTLSNTLQNDHLDSKRREAMKDLKNLSLLGIGGILGLQIYKDSKTSFDNTESSLLDSPSSSLTTSLQSHTLDSTLESSSLESLQSHSNIPPEILSLPLRYFNVPQAYTILLESNLTRSQRENLTYILPLLTSKDFDHTMPSLYHSYNVENINTHRIYNETSTFLQYHYDTLGSLLKDLQSHNFIARDYRELNQDSINLTESILQEILQNIIINHTNSNISLDDMRRYQVPKDSSLYKEFRALESEEKASAIDAYNEALEILADYKDYFFTNTPKKNDQGKILSYKDDKNKARRLVECLNIIGHNNVRALYVGVNDDKPNNDNNHTPSSLSANADSKEDSNPSPQDKKRPKFIGRLATTIIVEDGLWLG